MVWFLFGFCIFTSSCCLCFSKWMHMIENSTRSYSAHVRFVSTSYTGGYFTNCLTHTHTHDWDIWISSVSKHTRSHSSLPGEMGGTPASQICARMCCARLSGWPTVARPAVRYGPAQLALTPAHLPELTRRSHITCPEGWNVLWCPGSAPWNVNLVWQTHAGPLALTGLEVWGAAPDQTRSQEHATATTTADRLPGRYHLV